MELIWPERDLEWRKYRPAASATSSATATPSPMANLWDFRSGAAAAEIAEALAGAADCDATEMLALAPVDAMFADETALAERPESRSRLRRARSERRSAAL